MKQHRVFISALALATMLLSGCNDTTKCPVCGGKPVQSWVVDRQTRLRCANDHTWAKRSERGANLSRLSENSLFRNFSSHKSL